MPTTTSKLKKGRNTLLNEMADLPSLSSEREERVKSFVESLGFSAKNLLLWNLSFSHRSYSNEYGMGGVSNEKLEFLGDSVLGFIVVCELFSRFPDRSEGDLTKVKSRIVSEPVLAEVAVRIGLPSLLLLGKGERTTGGEHKTSLQADSLEALIGVIYLEVGLEEAKQFVLSHWQRYFKTAFSDPNSLLAADFKSRLQVFSQKNRGCVPHYEVLKQEGPEHRAHFFVNVSLEGTVLGEGDGSSRKEAEQQAAQRALVSLGHSSENPEIF